MVFNPEVIRHVSLPVIKFAIDKACYVRITGPMHIGKAQKSKAGEKSKDPATLAPAVNLETGEVGQIIVSAVLKGLFTDEYSGDAYVGKCFSIIKRAVRPGKNYNQYDVAEIRDPAAEEAAPAAAAFSRGRRA